MPTATWGAFSFSPIFHTPQTHIHWYNPSKLLGCDRSDCKMLALACVAYCKVDHMPFKVHANIGESTCWYVKCTTPKEVSISIYLYKKTALSPSSFQVKVLLYLKWWVLPGTQAFSTFNPLLFFAVFSTLHPHPSGKDSIRDCLGTSQTHTNFNINLAGTSAASLSLLISHRISSLSESVLSS